MPIPSRISPRQRRSALPSRRASAPRRLMSQAAHSSCDAGEKVRRPVGGGEVVPGARENLIRAAAVDVIGFPPRFRGDGLAR